MFSDYASLLSRATAWAGGSSDSNFPAAVADAVLLCEGDLNSGAVDDATNLVIPGLRVPEMVNRSLLAVAKAFSALPPDFLELRSAAAIVDGVEYPLRPAPEDGAGALAARYAGQGPRWFVLQGRQVRVLPAPSGTIDLRLAYFADVPSVAGSNPCYAVLQAYPSVYLYGTLRHLANYVRDQGEEGPRFSQMFAGAVRAANKAARNR